MRNDKETRIENEMKDRKRKEERIERKKRKEKKNN